MWTFTLFWYCIYNDFDGSYLFEYTYIVLVNVVFTSLPVIFMGFLDQDVDDKVSLAVPQLYMRGIERKEWSQTKFWYVNVNLFFFFFFFFFFLLPPLLSVINEFQVVHGRWSVPVTHLLLHAVSPVPTREFRNCKWVEY